ncbi:MAG: MBOAT family O-acyltransferase [Bacteroidales bacterium]
MVFSSIIFLLFFLPTFFIVYYAVPKKARNYVLLAFSLVFYAYGSPRFIFFLIGSCLANFYLVKYIEISQVRLTRRWLLSLSILINLGLLFYFKYANFFLDNVNFVRELFGAGPYTWERIVLPIGISFFTFQSLTYSIDVYRKVNEPLTNPFEYLLYISMFPQLIAGPIVRYQTIADQIRNRSETWEGILYGFYRFILGLSKKILIADVLAREVDKVFAMDLASLDSSTGWITLLAYTFQLYFDFSGYSDMAIGLGRMMGFRFPENFNNPYISGSMSEYWRRWHMTFSTFMKYYLYFPLGGSRVKTQRRIYLNLWIVFLISGIWHGASWNFLIYGAIHGFIMMLERMFLLKVYAKMGRILPIIITFFIIVLARVFFRIESLSDSMVLLKSLFTFESGNSLAITDPHFYTMMVFGFIFSFISLTKAGSWLEEKFYTTVYTRKQHILFSSIYLVLIVLCIASLSGSGFSPFIYFRF